MAHKDNQAKYRFKQSFKRDEKPDAVDLVYKRYGMDSKLMRFLYIDNNCKLHNQNGLVDRPLDCGGFYREVCPCILENRRKFFDMEVPETVVVRGRDFLLSNIIAVVQDGKRII